MLYLLKVILQLTLRKAGFTLGINLTKESKSLKMVPGRHCAGAGLRCNMGPSCHSEN